MTENLAFIGSCHRLLIRSLIIAQELNSIRSSVRIGRRRGAKRRVRGEFARALRSR
jgi:hypothetical protein